MRVLMIAAAAVLLSACGSEKKADEPAAARPASAPVPKPEDESRRFPQANLVDTKVVDEQLMGKSFMPGGTLARYRKGKLEYEMFVAKAPDAQGAVFALNDWRKALADAKLVPAFGGYFGSDAGEPVFVFTKGAWIAGTKGLSEKQADLPARELASRLP